MTTPDDPTRPATPVEAATEHLAPIGGRALYAYEHVAPLSVLRDPQQVAAAALDGHMAATAEALDKGLALRVVTDLFITEATEWEGTMMPLSHAVDEWQSSGGFGQARPRRQTGKPVGTHTLLRYIFEVATP